MNEEIKKYFDYWIPLFKKMRFIYKVQGDIKAIIELEDEIWKNWKLTREEKKKILSEIRGKCI